MTGSTAAPISVPSQARSPPVPFLVARRIELGALAELLNFAGSPAHARRDVSALDLHANLTETYYGWPLNQRTSSAAIHTVAHRLGLTAFGIDYSADREEPVGRLDPRPLAERMEAIVRTKNRGYSLLVIVWAAHTHLIVRCNSTFYLGFQGKSGSGKGTAIESCISLTPNGVVLSDATDAYLASVLNEGRAIGLEEWDSLVRKNPGIEALLRNGYRRGATRGIMVQKGQGSKWEEATLSLFGPKVYDTHTGPSGHLLGRSIIFPMEPDDSVDRALDAEDKAELLRPLKSALEGRARLALIEWQQDRVDRHLRSPEFRARVASMGGRTGRDHVIAALILLTCDMMGWDLESELRPIISGRTTVEEFGLEAEVLETIRRVVGDIRPERELSTEGLLGELNKRRQETGVAGRLTLKGLGGALRELGFKKGPEWERAKSGPNRDTTVVRPYRILREWSDRPDSTPEFACPSRPSCPPPQETTGSLGTLGIQNSSSQRFDPEDLFPGTPTKADRARGSASAETSESTEPPTEMDRAIAQLGPSITYPDGRVTDRRSGVVIAYPRDWPSFADGRPADGGTP
jgi:hypothetical protein